MTVPSHVNYWVCWKISAASPIRLLCTPTGKTAVPPSFAINRPGEETGVVFAGIPMGHEFTSLVLALLQVGGHPPKTSQALLDQIKDLDGEMLFETYYSLSCQNCPDVVQALNLMAIFNPKVRHVAIDGALFQDEVESREIMSVPSIYLNGKPFDQGRMTLEQILAKVDTGAAEREAKKLSEKSCVRYARHRRRPSRCVGSDLLRP